MKQFFLFLSSIMLSVTLYAAEDSHQLSAEDFDTIKAFVNNHTVLNIEKLPESNKKSLLMTNILKHVKERKNLEEDALKKKFSRDELDEKRSQLEWDSIDLAIALQAQFVHENITNLT